WHRVYQGGLRVYTTIDPDLQRAAEGVLESGLEDIERRRGYAHPARSSRRTPVPDGAAPDYLQGALIAIDPSNGHVRAMVGGRDFNESRFNRAVQARRQAGSAFKPFVFAAALEAGYSPASMITGLNDPIPTLDGSWLPEEGHTSADAMSLRAALRVSSNRAAVQLLTSVGIPETVGYAEKLNVGTPPSVPSLALGSGDVTLTAMTAAYGAFADKGIVHTPVLIRMVRDSDGAILYENPGQSRQAVSEATAFLMASMLAEVVTSGTGYRARQSGFTVPAGGKTGTTNDYNDAWFVGFTPTLVSGVWIGFDQPKTIIPNGYAGDLAVPIWASFMRTATRGAKPEWFERPANIVGVSVCRMSGRLPNDGCHSVPVVTEDGGVERKSMVYTEFFVRGRQPSSTCDVHASPTFVDRLAGIFGKGVGTPVSAGAAGLPPPPPPVRTSGAGSKKADPPENADSRRKAEEPPRKRGFWSRLFGFGGDDAKKKEEEEKQKREEQRKKEEERRRRGGPGLP
ncbi:MAG TPA: penicillin-binding transpeptidase domain-containing protein, partial [Vicinamibacterales bacterium]|nr:penicillin-binding transpeptidase domain-containing protein [Vicinamibacterales bacterium]